MIVSLGGVARGVSRTNLVITYRTSLMATPVAALMDWKQSRFGR